MSDIEIIEKDILIQTVQKEIILFAKDSMQKLKSLEQLDVHQNVINEVLNILESKLSRSKI